MDDVCSLPGHVEQVLEHVDDMNGFGVVVHRPRRKPVTEEKREKGNNYNNILRCIKKYILIMENTIVTSKNRIVIHKTQLKIHE